MQPVFRFAPSPNGYLHLGHAYSALLNLEMAGAAGGRLLLRIEDIDTVRCKQAYVDAALEDLGWLGLKWEPPVLRQSEQLPRYRATLETLAEQRLVYPCFCTRTEIAMAARQDGAGLRDPDGTPIYPGTCRKLPLDLRQQQLAQGQPHSLRLDLERALRTAAGDHSEAAAWGDVVLGRKDIGTSYHLAVVLDDALQGVTHVVRGQDLLASTSIHKLLQSLLKLPTPIYHHHDLILDGDGQKLAKSRLSTPIRQLRADGMSSGTMRQMLGF